MSEDLNKTHVRRPDNKRTFLWFGLEDNSKEELTNHNTLQNSPKPKPKEDSTAFVSIDFEYNQIHDLEDENRVQNQTKKLKRTEMAFNWIPFGQNFANIASDDNNFVVPQRLPAKLKKKLTPMKTTPVRRSSIGSSSSLRRATFRVTPGSRAHLNILSATSTKKKRRSSGARSSVFKTPSRSQLLLETPTPSSLIKSCKSVEDVQYISWINVMLASKVEEKADKIDSNQLILDCFNSHKTSASVCPTKEEVSIEAYQESFKWNQLRSSANALYRSEDMIKVNKKIATDVLNKKYSIRNDRGLHADVGIRKDVLELLLSYNPLWLRIGLETVFQQKIAITCHSMRLILGKFIADNLLVSKELMAKYGHKTVSHFFKDEHHVNEAKKHILAKFLLLLNFLDWAKQIRLIEHNPCLFRKNSRCKSTVDLIMTFARDDITGLGDITKHLRSFGFSMSYIQTPIEEFDFEVKNLAVDLRCGIRLARIAELITDHKDLLPKLLYPANNITRKLHNMEIALKALASIVPKGITAKDIVSGHRKKSFQLLDAIIFKHKEHQILMKEKLFVDSVVVIQKQFRRRQQMIKERQHFLELRRYTLLLQKRFRENKALRIERRERIRIEKSILFVQRKFRANKLMRVQRNDFQILKASVVFIQQIFRANHLMRTQRSDFQRLKASTIWIQRRFRANNEMKRVKHDFIQLKNAVICLQTRFRANRMMRIERKAFENLKYSAIFVQRIFRANTRMKIERKMFQDIKLSAAWVQSRFRANKEMKTVRQNYQNLKSSAISIQRRLRANQSMRAQRNRFLDLKHSTICIQRRFREIRATKRFDHMQQHSAQMLITAIARQTFSLMTTSFVIEEQVSYIELDSIFVNKKTVEHLERIVNQKIRSATPVFLQLLHTKSGVQETNRFEFPEDQNEPIRVISIEGVDRNPCCGTHVSNLSQLQSIKLLYTEKGKKNKTNLYFLCGNRVLSYLDKSLKIEKSLKSSFESTPEELLSIVEKMKKNKVKLQINHTLVVISVTDDSTNPSSSGQLAITGNEEMVQKFIPKVSELMSAKGMFKDGKFVAKVTNLSKRAKLDEIIQSNLK